MDNNSGDEHIFETVGKCRIKVHNGHVVEIGEPRIKDCPLAKRFEIPVDEISKKAIKKTIEQRIRSFGMCTARRKVISDQEFFGFAPAELLACGLRNDMFDAAICNCDGAGTLIITNPAMVLGISGLLSGLISTSPIPEVMDRIEQYGGVVFDRIGASLDPLRATIVAQNMGFSRIAIPVSDPSIAENIRTYYPGAFIFGVHMSGIAEEDAQRMVEVSDLVTGCASKTIRSIAGKRALLQVGAVIPIFALTPTGKELIMKRVLEADEKFFLKPTTFPVVCDNHPEPLL